MTLEDLAVPEQTKASKDKAWRQKQKALGLCTRCIAPARAGKTTCADHKYGGGNYAVRRAAGVCFRCTKPVFRAGMCTDCHARYCGAPHPCASCGVTCFKSALCQRCATSLAYKRQGTDAFGNSGECFSVESLRRKLDECVPNQEGEYVQNYEAALLVHMAESLYEYIGEGERVKRAPGVDEVCEVMQFSELEPWEEIPA